MSVQVSYKKQFVLGIFLILIILSVIEGIARIYEYSNPGCMFVKTDAFENTDFAILRQICSDSNALSFEKSTIQLIAPDQHFPTININSYGFRGPEIMKDKPEDVYRIFVVGGSTLFGAGSTSDQTSIPGFLQKKFIESNLNGKVEVINAGIPGAWSLSETYYIKNILLEFDPDLFIVYDGANDARYVKLEEEIKYTDPKITINEFTIAKLIPFYRTPFVLYHFLFDPDLPPGKHVPDAELAPCSKDNRCPTINNDISVKLVSLWVDRWLDVCELGKREGFSTIIALQPIVVAGNKSLSPYEFRFAPHTEYGFGVKKTLEGMSDSLNELAQSCDKADDLRGIFDNVSEPLYFDDSHVNDAGNEIVAQRLFELSLPLINDKPAI